MPSIYARMSELASAGRKFAVATVVRTQGSTPQVVGAKLIVSDDENERPRGTLGGGCVEADAILARRAQRGAEPGIFQSSRRAADYRCAQESLSVTVRLNTGLPGE